MFKYIWIGMLLVILVLWFVYAITDIIVVLQSRFKNHIVFDLEPLTVFFIFAALVALFISSFLYWLLM